MPVKSLERAGNYAVQAELDLMGCVLCAPDETLPIIRKIVSAGDFQREDAKAVYIAACQLSNDHSPSDATLIQAKAAANGNEIDTQFLAEVMRRFVTTANVEATAILVHEAACEREAKNIGFALMQGEYSITDAISRLQDVTRGHKSSLATSAEDANEFYDKLSAVASGDLKMFLSTGFPQLDKVLSGGLIKCGMITLAARPGTGKTTMGLCIADNVAAAGGKVLYESLEMSKYQLWSRRGARLAGLNYANIQQGKLTERDWEKLSEAMQDLSTRQLVVNDKPASIDEIEKRVLSCGADLVVIDHMGLVRPERNTKGPKYEIATEISHRIKCLAQSAEIPILNLCQLNRASEGRRDKRATLADLRDTGAIEEDSDAVIFLHRPAMYMPKEERPNPWVAQDMEVIVEKNRHGMTGSVMMDFWGVSAKVVEQRNDV